MSTSGIAIREQMLRNSRGALGFVGKTTAISGGTDRIRDAIRFDMNTLSPEDVSGGFIRITQAYTGTATSTGATTLTNTGAPFTATTLIDAIVVAYTAPGATTAMTITSNSTTVLTGSGGWSNGTPASTSTYYVTYSHVAKVIRLDQTTGDIYFDPAFSTATTLTRADTRYELWYFGIRPDSVDNSRDEALTTRASGWRMKPLSVLKEVADWSTAADGYANGGVLNATAAPRTATFPFLGTNRIMRVTNTAGDGKLSSEPFSTYPGQTMRVFGWMSIVQGQVGVPTVTVKMVDNLNAAYITAQGDAFFTGGFGWQGFDILFTIPSTATEDVTIELSTDTSTAVIDWGGIGMMPTHQTWYSHESRVLSKHDIGTYYEVSLPTSVTGHIMRSPINAVKREQAGEGVVAIFDEPPSLPVYYQERHRYDALQSDYLSLVNRATGDHTPTEVNVDYAAWATTVELLEARKRTTDLDRLYTVAEKNLRHWDRRVGPDPTIVNEYRTQGSVFAYPL